MYKLLLGVSAIALGFHSFDAYACSCTQVTEHQRYLEASDVMLGTVVATKLVTKNVGVDEQDPSADPIGALPSTQVEGKIQITKTIKGKTVEEITLIDGVANGANCAVGLLTGREYLIYLYDNNALSICSGTRLYNEFSDHTLLQELESY